MLNVTKPSRKPDNVSYFGGCMFVGFGDHYQLPPVRDKSITYTDTSKMTVSERYGKHIVNSIPDVIILRTVYRQNTDYSFEHLLKAIRDGHVSESQFNMLNQRLCKEEILI